MIHSTLSLTVGRGNNKQEEKERGSAEKEQQPFSLQIQTNQRCFACSSSNNTNNPTPLRLALSFQRLQPVNMVCGFPLSAFAHISSFHTFVSDPSNYIDILSFSSLATETTSKPSTAVRLQRSRGQVIQDCDVYIGKKWNRGNYIIIS